VVPGGLSARADVVTARPIVSAPTASGRMARLHSTRRGPLGTIRPVVMASTCCPSVFVPSPTRPIAPSPTQVFLSTLATVSKKRVLSMGFVT
jgi:hypothetical protein